MFLHVIVSDLISKRKATPSMYDDENAIMELNKIITRSQAIKIMQNNADNVEKVGNDIEKSVEQTRLKESKETIENTAEQPKTSKALDKASKKEK